MQCIAELENRPRGLYTGALGWLSPGGDCRFNVAIRTLQIAPDGQAQLGIGSGIVSDADPEREYAECLLKANFLTACDPGFELIETLRLERGEYPLISYHLDRLEASASALGFSGDLKAIHSALMEQALNHVQGVFRVRLSLAHNGHFRLEVGAMAQGSEAWEAVLSDEILDPENYLLRHKTTVRSRYNNALARLAETPEVFDAIFFNSRGEVCEGARSNVFIERAGQLLTPSLSCGLLPGVMRRHLLESGRAVESVLTRDDLLGAPKVYLANALRGLLEVTLRV
jgi:para-aminobenzoate synthetase/4-amino-4-deoxychorismate lyase